MTGRHVHVLAGFTPAGKKVRAWCSCGEPTTPRVNEGRALEALEAEHGTSTPVCERCRHEDWQLPPRRHAHLQVLLNGRPVPDLLAAVVAASRSDEEFRAWRSGRQSLVCADEAACGARVDTRNDEFRAERRARPVQPPRLRVIRGGRE